MNWVDDAIVLSTRSYGETSVIVNLLTQKFGRHAGLVKGGKSARFRGVYQPGNKVRAHWKSRLSEHLGTFNCELTSANAAKFLSDPLKLAALSSACSIIEFALPDREKHEPIFSGLNILIAALEKKNIWPNIYIRLELGILKELGFELDLSSCAATGTKKNLVYVSPKTGRAVSQTAGQKYHSRMLKLPKILVDQSIEPRLIDVAEALTLTEYFFKRCCIYSEKQNVPAARRRFVEKLITYDSNQPSID